MIDFEAIKRCPVYGSSKETIKLIMKERMEKALDDIN
jgi:hypothetical protein